MVTPRRPVAPPRTEWRFPPAETADDVGVVAIGADLAPGTILEAYRNGIFPMPIKDLSSDIDLLGSGVPEPKRPNLIAWWSPEERGIVPLDSVRVSRSLRRSMRRFDVTFDTDFTAVLRACADPSRTGSWIDDQIEVGYTELHRLGWVHSVEVRDPDTGGLVGGLYGVHIDGLFAGESMFHHVTDASKVAFVALVERLRAIGVVLLDTQWLTPHLQSLGAIEIPRAEYLARLRSALATPVPSFDPDLGRDN